MVNASKILTVSYGTFSCTLEGFDDPVGAMQTVAEYFRDLAADDPHFGAEPPKLDQAALSQIAERQTQKRVDATVEKDNLVIRQIDAPTAEPLPNAAPTDDPSADLASASKAPAPSSVQDNSPNQRHDLDSGGQSKLATAGLAAAAGIAGTAAAAGVAESVSEKLARIRAAVRRSRTEPEPLLNQMFTEDEGAEAIAEPDVAFEPINALDEAEPLSFDEQDDVDTLSEEMDLTGLIETGPAEADEADTEGSESGTVEAVLAEEEVEPAADDATINDSVDPIEAVLTAAAEPEEPTEAPLEEALDQVAETAQPSSEEIEALAAPEPESAPDMPADLAETPEIATPLMDQPAAEAEAFTSEPDSPAPEPEAAETVEDTLAAVLAETADIAAPTGADAFEEDLEDSAEPAPDEIDLSAVLQQAEPDAPAEEEAASSAPDPAPVEELPEALDLSTILGGDPEPEAEPEPEAAQAPEPELGDALAEFVATQERAAEEGPGAPRVRVMKMSRAEFEQQFEEAPEDDAVLPEAEATAEEVAQAVEPGDIRETLGETGLSEEDEEDLIRELMAATQDDATQVDAVPDEESPTAGDTQRALDDTTDSAPLVLTAPITPEQQPGPLEAFDAAEATQATAALPEDDAEDVQKTLEKLVQEADKVSSAGAEQLNISPEDDGASVDRLLAEADSAMEDNEGNRRRSAIAHLKAAVAAVRADGDRERDAAEAETARAMDRFREDLARAVRPNAQASVEPSVETEGQPTPAQETPPAEAKDASETVRVTPRRPAAAAPEASPDTANATTGDATISDATDPVEAPAAKEGGTPRPRRAVTPLMLVSEQRVDKAEDVSAQAEPVRPRRIQTEAEADTPAPAADTNADEFKAFLVKTGADGLQEELEASLAYGIFVEGADHNARPRIMGRVLRQYPDGSVTREDGLRAFGVLLREGRINRIRRGEFTLPDTSRFHPKNNTQADTA